MGQPPDGSGFDRSKAEMFEALGHPLRIKLLEAMKDGPVSFSELKKRTGIESSGHLTFHLDKLDGLVTVNRQGNYILSDLGKEALAMTERIGAPLAKQVSGNRVSVNKSLLGALLITLFVLAVLAAPAVSGFISQTFPRRYIGVVFFLSADFDRSTGQLVNESVWCVLENHDALKGLTSVTIESNGTLLLNESGPGGPNWSEITTSYRFLEGYHFGLDSYYDITVTLAFSDGSHQAATHGTTYGTAAGFTNTGVWQGLGFTFDVY
jgi:DNA-binding transcriptional ArsR family regulator